jgi:hypothetical protein
MRILMVSGCRLAWHREIVSQPSEKTHSTATADPEDSSAKKRHYVAYISTRYTEKILCKPKEIRKLGLSTHPPMNRIAPLKIFGWKLEIFIEFIDDCHGFLMETGCKVLLRRV